MIRIPSRDIGYCAAIVVLAAALAFSLIDAGRAHTKTRNELLARAAQNASGRLFFVIPLTIVSVAPGTRQVTYQVFSTKLGTEQRFRATVREQAVIAEYTPRRDGEVIVGFDAKLDRSLTDIPAGTRAIASFTLSPDDELIIERLVYGSDLFAP